ncbi:LytR/AlgR family response regulator transcription factor [Leuconostoc miyukkimchii]|uniref:LytR/AlgR family response regulator transcription factor n=1 Tax=Leuconostoc miyukkimchii TaxID=910540 RepID=UPI001C7DAB14|nr:LytTR family DNA-binding domain-containing protein [Leuconostoc miyukkimchii]
MRIAIVDDKKEIQQQLGEFIKTYSTDQQIPITVTYFSNGLEIVDNYRSNFDVIYFDVQMPIMDGMTAAKKIRQVDENVIIVFLTNYVQWAVEGYSVNAFDFILKPLSYFVFTEHFKKIQRKILETSKSILIKNKNGMIRILLNNLYFVESDGHYLIFHTVEKNIETIGSMKKIESELTSKNFFRCNNGYLVNLAHVNNFTGNIVQVGHYDLQISRPRKKLFIQALTNYLGKVDN